MIPEATILEFWKPILALLCGVLAWIFWNVEERHIERLQTQVAQLQVQHATDAKTITDQNAAVDQLKVEGKQMQAKIDAQAQSNETAAAKVVTQWKTKYVPVPIPADCPAAIAVGAENAAAVARTFMGSP